ncbi:hypothetical protein E1B28_010632 [Marasmius oreades]|uniref:BTB/POZ domain-containing protein n=1 Tax=Marasmius oreades TaxID=181124 RepID=A0A9P7RY51_9AGAR|nr:uncharacterized protein E1B28_010632 [Marasmius oreades]KAG7091613.1 hypothetical protein E1B28_010632 [Marasmius oreades]
MDMPTPLAPACRVEGCMIAVDVVLQSSDNELFGAHTKNLECFNEGFPPAGWAKKVDEVVVLTESSAVLTLLLGFTHNSLALPDLEDGDIDIDNLLSLCEAAEKYGNFIALQACRRGLKNRAKTLDPDGLLKVLRYKVCRFDSTDINDFARRTPGIPVKEVWSFYKGYPEVYYLWSRYQIAWAEWDAEFDSAMDINSYPVRHLNDVRQCPELDKYLDYFRGSKKVSGIRVTWEVFNSNRMFVNGLPGIKTMCGCGAFTKWTANIQKVFERQPRWEDFTN